MVTICEFSQCFPAAREETENIKFSSHIFLRYQFFRSNNKNDNILDSTS